MQEENLDALVRNKGFKFSSTFFPYTSGEIGPYYVNSECVMKTPKDYALAVKSISDLVAFKMKDEPEYAISGGESRDWIFSNPVAIRLGKPALAIYKDGKIVPGDFNLEGRTFAHVADLNNEGSSPRDLWVPVTRKKGGIVKNIFFYVDRLEGGISVMEKLGLNSQAVVPLDSNAWDYLQKIEVVSPEVYKNLRERGKTHEERNAWATNMLRSESGLETLTQLIVDPKTLDKAAKILSKGYPDLEFEVRERLEPILDKVDKNLYVNFWNRIVSQRQNAAAK